MIQTVETTKEEKVEMYNKLSKKELIELLIEANNLINKITQPTVNVNRFDTNTPIFYHEVCGCNPLNGGSGICGCTMANIKVNKNNHTTTDWIDFEVR